MEEFQKYARYDGEALGIYDQNLKAYVKVGGAPEPGKSWGRPEIDRSALRQILLDSLPEGTIEWGSRLRRIDAKDVSLHFDHGVERDFDLVVGADGHGAKYGQ